MKTDCLVLLTVAIAIGLPLAWGGNHTENEDGKTKVLIRSKRRWVLSTIELEEEDTGPFPKMATQMFNDRIKELKDNHKFRITGNGVDEEPLGVFSIDEKTGWVYVHKSIDREKNPTFTIKFDILDMGNKPIDRTLAFDVAIKDINDNAPVFDTPNVRANVRENLPEGYLPVVLNARDADEENTPNSNITLAVVNQEPAEPKIGLKVVEGTRTTQLTFAGCFDYDKAKKYTVIVQAKDKGVPSLSSSATIVLDIVDQNTHLPVFKEKQLSGQVMEMESNKEIMRLGVTDADTPNTPAWRAKYSILKGNEDGNYKMETDPKTNEGILTVIKGKDYEKTTLALLEIGVENEEPLFVCGSAPGDGGKGAESRATRSLANVTIKVIDVNDPPVFAKVVSKIYEREEEEPGKAIFTPTVTDEDSDVKMIRYKLVDDKAGWLSIDNKTGKVTTIKRMDRESPFVDKNNIYTVLVCAIDDGEPPATATSTLLITLGDLNDNTPYLINRSLVLCGNQGNKIPVAVEDFDNPPYSGPFTFSLEGEDKTLKTTWGLDPSTGMEAGLISLKTLPFGNYTVPLVIQDQQGNGLAQSLGVVVCDCGGGTSCRGRLPHSSKLGSAALGLLLGALLLLLLLLCCCLLCECGKQSFKHIPFSLQDDGNQTLIKYNEEGGGSPCKAEPTLILTQRNSISVVDGQKQASIPLAQMSSNDFNEMYRTYERNTMSSSSAFQSAGMQRVGEANGTMKSQMGRGTYSSWKSSRMRNSSRSDSARFSRSVSLRADQRIAEHLERRLHMIGGDQLDYPAHQPYVYAYEGQGSKCQSLDEMSLSNLGDDLEFLENLGPTFNNLGGMCHQAMQGGTSHL